MEVQTDTDAPLRERLGNFLRTHPGMENVTVSDLRRIGGGSSRENWFFEVHGEAGSPDTRQLVLRRDPSKGLINFGRSQEFKVMAALANTPVPAPQAFYLDTTGEWLDRPFLIMERVAGIADRKVLTTRGPLGEDVDKRKSLARDLCTVLAEIHRVHASDSESSHPEDERRRPDGQLAYWTELANEHLLEPIPLLAMARWWLRDQLPAPVDSTTLVHGDFRPANVLVDNGHVAWVLDWETAHVGDPDEDLGWYCTPLYRREHFIADRWEENDFLAAYESQSGRQVDPSRLRFWKVLAGYKLTVMAIMAAHGFLNGLTERAAATPGRFLKALGEAMQT